VEKHGKDQERESKADASIRAGKARNGPGKGNPKQMQILYKMWKGMKRTKKRQSKADASKRGGKARNRPGKGNTNQLQV
jgi:hypothetical protein